MNPFSAIASAAGVKDSSSSNITFEAFSDVGFNTSAGKWTGKFNPSTLSMDARAEYFDDVPIGGSGTELRFKRLLPSQLALTIMLDNFDSDSSNLFMSMLKEISDPEPIIKQVTALEKVIYSINSDTHEPNFVRMQFGDNTFYGRSVKFQVKYTEFKANGEATRADIDLAFTGAASKQLTSGKLKLNSPDMTHAYMVKEGDTLTWLAAKYYDNPQLYIELARFNKLKSLRSLKPGMTLIIPPLVKQ